MNAKTDFRTALVIKRAASYRAAAAKRRVLRLSLTCIMLLCGVTFLLSEQGESGILYLPPAAGSMLLYQGSNGYVFTAVIGFAIGVALATAVILFRGFKLNKARQK